MKTWKVLLIAALATAAAAVGVKMVNDMNSPVDIEEENAEELPPAEENV